MSVTLLETARAYVKAGLSIIPVNPAGHEKAKAPALSSWKDYQQRRPSDAELKEWFATGRHGVGLISGAISGNLETLDFDEAGIVESFMQSVQGYDLDLFEKVKRTPLVQTPSGGAHLRYRCATPIEGNKKLAMTADKKVRIETRGEGGYAVAPPSPGYILLQGDLTNLPELSPDDRDLLHAIAKLEFDLTPFATYQAPAEQPRPARSEGEGKRPGDDYNERGAGDALALLQRHGWQVLHQRGEVYHLRKPNSTSRTPHATFGHRGAFLYVFSSSAPPFEPERGYSPFAIYALLECDGDHSEAAKRLAQDGYGDPLSERPHPSCEHAKRFSAILESEGDNAPENEGENEAQIFHARKNSYLKNADFCTKKDSQNPLTLAVWKARGRRLKREKRDFEIAWTWAVGEWYIQSVENVEHGEKERAGKEIFGEELPRVRKYASIVTGWKSCDMEPEQGMTRRIAERLAKVPKEVKEKYCHEWRSGVKWTDDTLKERLETEDGIAFAKREKEEDFAGKALEMLRDALGHEALEALGKEITKHGRTKEILADAVTKLAARINGYGEQAEEADAPQSVAPAPPEPKEPASTRKEYNYVDSICNLEEPASVITPEPVAALPSPMESATPPEQEAVPSAVAPPEPPQDVRPAPMPRVPNALAVVKERPPNLLPPLPFDDEEAECLFDEEGSPPLFDVSPVTRYPSHGASYGLDCFTH